MAFCIAISHNIYPSDGGGQATLRDTAAAVSILLAAVGKGGAGSF